jgi:hypothetical protein
MRYTKLFAWFTLAVGMAGASVLSAEEPYWDRRDTHNDRQDLRQDSRDLRRDYSQVNDLRSDIARDRARLNEDIRCGRDQAAAQDARDLARDQRALNAQSRDIQHDRADMYWDHRDLRRDYRDR